jgi:hypothetical protein
MAQRPESPALWRKAGCAMAQLASLNFDRSPKKKLILINLHDLN